MWHFRQDEKFPCSFKSKPQEVPCPNRRSSVHVSRQPVHVSSCLPTPTMTHRREKHRPSSHQMMQLHISSETSESNRECCCSFLSVGCTALSPHYLTSSFLAPHFSTDRCPQPLILSRKLPQLRTKCPIPTLLLFLHPLFVPLLMPFPSWKS